MSAEPGNRLSVPFEFSDEDLRLNREGKLTGAQIRKLDAFRKSRLFALIGYAILITLILLGGIAGSAYLFFSHPDPSLQIAVPLSAGFVVLIAAGAAVHYFLRTNDLLTLRISSEQGQAHLYTRNYSDGDRSLGTGWFLKLGGKEFRLQNQAQYQALEEGSSYRVYFIKGYPIHYILSLEPS